MLYVWNINKWGKRVSGIAELLQYLFESLTITIITTVKSSPALFLPDSTHCVRKMCVLSGVAMMRVSRSILIGMGNTNTLSLVLAISSGLQTDTDMTPASNPEIKFTICYLK